MYELKQVIVVRQDLNLPKGKLGAQVAHAAVEAVLKSDKNLVKDWRNQGMPKIVLKTENLESLYKLNQQSKDSNIITAVITDAGKTVVEPGTVTCLAIGPDDKNKIDKIIKELKLL
ncbi:peptidyl-tRNA hydrolase [Candidatus Woesearchaeota archaeon]|nr:peptidyl-tRNA hydrolase [Candidatus Woesearchaeota archaeon]